MILSIWTRHMRQMSTHHIGTSGERLVRLVNSITAQHYRIATDSRLRVDYLIAPDHRRALPHLAADVEVAKQHQDVARQISLHLHRTKDTCRVMHLLACRDEDILPQISAVARSLA